MDKLQRGVYDRRVKRGTNWARVSRIRIKLILPLHGRRHWVAMFAARRRHGKKNSNRALSPRLMTWVIVDAGPRYASAASERNRPAVGLHASLIGLQFRGKVGTFTISP